VNGVEAPLDKDHFFLDGRRLDSFTKWVIDRADSEVVVVNPFVKECDLSQQLIESRIRGLRVLLVTRPPEESARRCHLKMKENNVVIHYDSDVHAKVVVVDGAVAVVSSMNFVSESSAGQSWEAGIVTTDPRVIASIDKAISLEMKV
jgi:phosphatidylserine/phosphatidylglycerophosphate/cardiolipin synthase-like enzyme